MSLLERVRSVVLGERARPVDYRAVRLSRDEIRGDCYKQLLGGGAEGWRARGAFQLELLIDRGLTEASSCLDLGCGPLRAGVHVIRHLAPGGYFGIDANRSFIDAARDIVRRNGLEDKQPVLQWSEDFTLAGPSRRFGYAIAFSVLNHCDEAARASFFRNVPGYLEPHGRLIISHAGWLGEERFRPAGLRVSAVITGADYDLGSYGWTEVEQASVFPILELTPDGGISASA